MFNDAIDLTEIHERAVVMKLTEPFTVTVPPTYWAIYKHQSGQPKLKTRRVVYEVSGVRVHQRRGDLPRVSIKSHKLLASGQRARTRGGFDSWEFDKLSDEDRARLRAVKEVGFARYHALYPDAP